MPWLHFPCPSSFRDREGFCGERLALHSNNPLAVELETENDAACEIQIQSFRHTFQFEAALSAATTMRISSNDQHVET
jgi:hypothetical protein